METKIFTIDSNNIDSSIIDEAGNLLRNNKLVAFPTETVYGLGANALNSEAVENIFKAKGRPQDNPLIVHIADKKDIHKLAVHIPDCAIKLAHEFWPGPLTIILRKNLIVPNAVSAGLFTVAIRMPNHPIALELIKAAGVPIAAPSANLSTKPSPTKAEHVICDLSGRIDAIIDGGDVDVGLESTVLDLTSAVPTILRPGKITKDDLEKVIGRVLTKTKSGSVAKSPGMKYKHYSPDAKVILAPIERFEELKKKYSNQKISEIKAGGTLEEYAHDIFSEFRRMDSEGVEVILVESVSDDGLGCAIMNRLKKAATEVFE